MQQVCKQPQARKSETDEIEAAPAVDHDVQARQAQMNRDVDDLLNEIDAVLEPNAQAFVQGYIQENGE